jgi:prophage DNA circulation protein
MIKADATEAAPIMQRAMMTLAGAGSTLGDTGADLRQACGYLTANALKLIQTDTAGPPLADCFEKARKAGFTQAQLANVRSTVVAEKPVSLGATMIQNSLIEMCLATECRVIALMTFISREDVDLLKLKMNDAFNAMEEIAADDMAQVMYRALVSLHGALMFHLIETARPLPRLLQFEFNPPMSTLTIAHRLYYDASRADELRDENKVVHPAFAPTTGRALSF